MIIIDVVDGQSTKMDKIKYVKVFSQNNESIIYMNISAKKFSRKNCEIS